MATSWVSGNRYLSDAEMRNNAEMFYDAMHNLGFSLNAIAGILGNAQTESGINPGIWESLDPFNGGYGLLQWTPYTNYSNWAGTGWQDNGQKECERIQYEFLNGIQYYPTVSYPMLALEFMTSLDSPEDLAETFLYNYERPADPSSSVNARRTQARAWFDYLTVYSYTPRLTYTGTDSSPYYTIWNPYWSWGTDAHGNPTWLGMNNCTAYAFGRWNEIAQVTGFNYNWPTGNGEDWYSQGIAKGFAYGNVPQLGAAISWSYPGGGHVAVVEQINYDAQGNPTSFVTSNSAYNHGQPKPGTGSRGPNQAGYNDFPWFYLETVDMNNLDNGYGTGSYNGFIYHPNIHSTPVPPGPPPTPPTPPTPPAPYTGSKMPFMLYLKRIL